MDFPGFYLLEPLLLSCCDGLFVDDDDYDERTDGFVSDVNTAIVAVAAATDYGCYDGDGPSTPKLYSRIVLAERFLDR